MSFIGLFFCHVLMMHTVYNVLFGMSSFGIGESICSCFTVTFYSCCITNYENYMINEGCLAARGLMEFKSNILSSIIDFQKGHNTTVHSM